MDEIVIKVTYDPDNGYYSFCVYDGHDAYMECKDSEAGLCPFTMQIAVDMPAPPTISLCLG